MSNKVEYVGKDLEAMAFAVKYHQWILNLMQPFMGKHLVEVGAGTGSVSEMLLEKIRPETFSAVEPSEMFTALQETMKKQTGDTEIKVYRNIFAEVAAEIKTRQAPDSIVYINVLEHIEDDAGELKLAQNALRPGGRVFVFVPALSGLFSEFDKQIGHFRRYHKQDLEAKCRAANLKILKLQYFDFLGIFPWWLKYRMLKSRTMEPGAVNLYDNVVVPFAKPFESIVRLPIGKNLLLVAEKSE